MAKRQWTQEEIEKQVQSKPNWSYFHDLEGMVFGMIVVGRYCGLGRWECMCDCGTHFITTRGVLIRPRTKSCGCYQASRTHGMSGSREYAVWCGMKTRCFYKNSESYKDYGGRGITIHPEWRDSFWAFYRDVGPCPSSEHSIDRYPNNDGNYEPGNVRWATQKEQNRNTRRNRFLTVHSITRTIGEWAEVRGIARHVIVGRLASGWSVEDAVTIPTKAVTRWNKNAKTINKA